MRTPLCFASLCLLTAMTAIPASAQQGPRPYRLESVDLKEPIIWSAEARGENGEALRFGGADQTAEDGRPHTRVLIEGEWRAIHKELRAKNNLQPLYATAWNLRDAVKNAQARARHLYFEGLPPAEEKAALAEQVEPQLARAAAEITRWLKELPPDAGDNYAAGQMRFATGHLKAAEEGLTAAAESSVARIRALDAVRIHLELAAEAFDAEPPARALDCGAVRRSEGNSPAAQSLVWEPKTKLFVLFGGDHLDYLTNDTWVFDPAARRWEQRHPAMAPAPRANHRLEPLGDGRLRLTGGYTYASNTDYLGGQYLDREPDAYIYDVAANYWSAEQGKTVELPPADSRTYRTGALHPDFFLEGDRPDAASFAARLAELPANTWVAIDPAQRPALNRDWGVARIDTRRDLMLRWSGGHSAHGGSDVPHFHFATGRWELAFPVEFPLGQLYSNTSYPNGWNFNRRPWVTGHTYQNYEFDPPSGMMVKAGRPNHFYVYDPDRADWVSRGPKPEAMRYNSCFYTLTCAATPRGIVCWGANGRVHRYDHEAGGWSELELSGDPLPGAHVDNSSIVYDSKRNRLLIVNTLGYEKKFEGTVYALDPDSGRVTALKPAGTEQAIRFATIDRTCYDAANDLLLMGTYLKDSGEQTPTPAYDCAENRWVLLDIAYTTGERLNNVRRDFPHGRSDALMHDARRNLIWGVDTKGQVYVLRLERKTANVRPLE